MRRPSVFGIGSPSLVSNFVSLFFLAILEITDLVSSNRPLLAKNLGLSGKKPKAMKVRKVVITTIPYKDFQLLSMKIKKSEDHINTKPSPQKVNEVAIAVFLSGRNSIEKAYPTKVLGGKPAPITNTKAYVS